MTPETAVGGGSPVRKKRVKPSIPCHPRNLTQSSYPASKEDLIVADRVILLCAVYQNSPGRQSWTTVGFWREKTSEQPVNAKESIWIGEKTTRGN